MKHRLGFVLVATIIALTLLAPATAARQSGPSPAAKFLEPSKYDSYVVIMKTKPLAATFGDDFDSAAATVTSVTSASSAPALDQTA